VAGLCLPAAHADHPALALGGAAAAPITTTSAVAVPQGDWSLGLRVEHVEYDSFSDAELARLSRRNPDADIHSMGSLTSIALSGAYGLTENLTLGASIPYVRRKNIRSAHGHDEHDEGGFAGLRHRVSDARHRIEDLRHRLSEGALAGLWPVGGHDDHGDEHEEETHHDDEHDHGEDEHAHEESGDEHGAGEVEALGDSEGLGDAILYAQYRFLNAPERGLHAAGILGLKTPTGKTDERAPDGHRLETHLQPGSGSWDPLAGAAVSWQRGAMALDASLLYKLTTRGSQDTELGDVLAYNAAFSYRLGNGAESEVHHHESGHRHVHGPSGAWDLVLELNGEWSDEENEGGRDNPDSGGNLLYVSPGVRYAAGSALSAHLSVGIPVVTDLNGHQVEPDWRLVAGLSVGF
jgi:hypothetical protein